MRFECVATQVEVPNSRHPGAPPILPAKPAGCQRFSSLEQAVEHAERYRAAPGGKQHFAVQIFDKHRNTGDQELCWDSATEWT